MSKYLLIKMTDDWVQNEHIKKAVKYEVDIRGGSIVKNGLISVSAASSMLEEELELYPRYQIEPYQKQLIANEIGRFLLDNNLIRIEEMKQLGKIVLKGSVIVVDERRTDDE